MVQKLLAKDTGFAGVFSQGAIPAADRLRRFSWLREVGSWPDHCGADHAGPLCAWRFGEQTWSFAGDSNRQQVNFRSLRFCPTPVKTDSTKLLTVPVTLA